MSKGSIKEAIRAIVDTNKEINCVVCTVDSVDVTKKTCYCLPIDESKADIVGARLMADNKTGFFLVPKVGSIVIVSYISNELTYVSMFSEVDEIQLNGDNFGGLVKIQELIDKLNNLENAFNQHLALYNTHTHAGVTSGGSSTAIPSAVDTNVLTPTVKTELENKTVNHGNGS